MDIAKHNIGDIVKFIGVEKFYDSKGFGTDLIDLLYSKRLDTWNNYNTLRDQLGIILEIRSIRNTIKPVNQKYYKGKNWIPYLWFCFKTAKIYLVYYCELNNNG